MKKRVIIIGGGFAGIAAARSLSNTSFEVLIIDKKNHHLFQPLLYQVASAALSPADISVPIREIVKGSKNISVYLDEIIKVNKFKKYIIGSSNKKYSFDYLLIATGSTPFYYGNDNWKKFAPGLKTLEDALSIRNKVLRAFEKYELNGNENLNFAIIGAGPTGVELAGAIAEIAYKTLTNEYNSYNTSKAKIYLIEGGNTVLPTFTQKLSAKTKKYLEDLGVVVMTDKIVKKIEGDNIYLEDQTIVSNNIIWAAGNRASRLIDKLKINQDRMGRAIVERNLSLKNNPNIFIVGDNAHFIGKNKMPLPALAPVATQQGKHVAKQIINDTTLPFIYFDKGSMATIGNFKAVMSYKKIKIFGPLAWLCWCFIHILFLINFRNRFMVFSQWAFMLIFKRKGVRIITDRESVKFSHKEKT